MKKDKRTKRFIFIPFCFICPAFQAEGIVKDSWAKTVKPVVEVLVEQDVNIVQMPCPESLFGGLKKNLKRQPASIIKYDNPDFRRHCHKLALETAKSIKAILSSGYQVVAILGLEYSPACSTKLQYTNKGTIHRSGIYMEYLQNLLKTEKIDIPFVGINKRWPKKSQKLITDLLK